FSFHPRADLNRTEIRVVDVETGAARALTGAASTHDREPAWSPDSRQVAFPAQRGEWYELRAVGLETGPGRPLGSERAGAGGPSCAARPAGGGLVPLGRRARDRGAAVPAHRRVAPSACRRLPARWPHRSLRRRLGRTCPVLRGQGLCLACAQLPRLGRAR